MCGDNSRTLVKLPLSDAWQVVSGECGVLSAIKPGKSFVDMSSVEVETAVELYEVRVLLTDFDICVTALYSGSWYHCLPIGIYH